MQRDNSSCVSRLFSVALRVPMLFSLALLLDTAVALSAQPSHLGQKVSDHVTVRMYLFGGVGACDAFAERTLPNGTRSQINMLGRWLVVTDVTWRTFVGPGFPSQQLGTLTLRIFIGADESPLFESSAFITPENINEPAFGSEHLTAGFVVSEIPCIEFQQVGGQDGGVGGQVILHGYLIDRPRTLGMVP
jgi:hypothetical protein